MNDPMMKMKIDNAIRRTPLLSPNTIRLLEFTSAPDPDIEAAGTDPLPSPSRAGAGRR